MAAPRCRSATVALMRLPSPTATNGTKFQIPAVGASTREPQRLGAAEPQPKCERPLNRKDAMVAEKAAGEKPLLEMRDSALLNCDERREKSKGDGAQSN